MFLMYWVLDRRTPLFKGLLYIQILYFNIIINSYDKSDKLQYFTNLFFYNDDDDDGESDNNDNDVDDDDYNDDDDDNDNDDDDVCCLVAITSDKKKKCKVNLKVCSPCYYEYNLPDYEKCKNCSTTLGLDLKVYLCHIKHTYSFRYNPNWDF